IHWPMENVRHDSWRALETVLADGRCRAVGVSNYTVGHLKQLKERSSIIPAVNQVEFSPFLYQKELLEYCQGAGILIEAYSPLTRAKRLDHEGLCERARAHGKTPAQVLIRWILQHGMVVLPKSVHKSRIEENSQVFDFVLSEDDMAYLDSLNENFRTCWNPENVS
ncbi:MAG: aldo/keto reductase, partial [Planctomycetota bacterium]|nr:aldo/keto reductase [Planctomycetota bacterium]